MSFDASRVRFPYALAFLLCIAASPGLAADRPAGLPTGPGQPCPLDLVKKELPRGYVPDDFANQNQDGEVHQWIMRGADRMDRVEINISQWGQRAESYMQWKQGMLWTGSHELVQTKLGEQTMYYESKEDCNKQLIMHHGPYLIEIHRPPKQGVTQAADPIDRKSFLEIADAVVARIAEVSNTPKSGWGGKLIRREVVRASQTPAYGPAAGPRFEAGHFTIRKGEKAESFQVVGGNSDVGAIYYWNSTKRHVFVRVDDWAGLTGLELGPGRYALSCNYMDKGTGAGATGSLRIAFDVVSGTVEPTNTGGGLPPLIDNDPKKPKPTFVMEPVISPGPVEIRADAYLLPPPETPGVPSIQGTSADLYQPGVQTFVQGTTSERNVVYHNSDREYTGAIWGLGKGETIGYFTGSTFHAEKPGYCWVWYTAPCTKVTHNDDGTTTERPGTCTVATLFRVVPGPDQPVPRMPWSTSSEQILKGTIFRKRGNETQLIDGARVTLQSDFQGGTVDPAWSAKDGTYGFTGRQLGVLSPGQYELRVYKKTPRVDQDLWNAQTETVTLPIAGTIERNIEVWRARKKFKMDIPVP